MNHSDVSLEAAIEAHIIDYLRSLGYLHLVRAFSESFSRHGMELSEKLDYSLVDLVCPHFAWHSFSGQYNDPPEVLYVFDADGKRVPLTGRIDRAMIPPSSKQACRKESTHLKDKIALLFKGKKKQSESV
uniref:Uncharacterized protein n=1 Tax=Paramoeba aestuarina TaxID=180227 RepID=A0A7S4JLD9_9EUKA|mmetsp:Transcript_11475/g.17363  ORF Transcript_11475/g.17363 Transcript_11475/m.17363 type:complete len:130 (+) Transcript_11475:41-430(+)